MNERVQDAITILEVVGRVDSLTAPDLGTKQTALLSAPQCRQLIDFDRLDYISSAGFRVLFFASKQARDGGGRLALWGLNEKANELFAIADFHKLIKVLPTRAAGLAELS